MHIRMHTSAHMQLVLLFMFQGEENCKNCGASSFSWDKEMGDDGLEHMKDNDATSIKAYVQFCLGFSSLV